MTSINPKQQSLSSFFKAWTFGRAKNESRRSFMFFEACVIGAVSALAILVFSGGVSRLSELRELCASNAPPYLVLPLFGLIGGAICGALVQFAPEITGSGIPQIKAFLKGFPMKLDLRVALMKLLGGVIALGIGLPLGREGPTVQVGGATAAVLGRVGYQSPRHRRQLIAAGAGAGLAAAFNAPLAGVMFIIEELLKEVSSTAIGTALLACFFAGVVSRYIGNHSLDVPAHSSFPQIQFLPSNFPFCLLLGIAAGVVGALFNDAIIGSMKLQDRIFKNRYILRVALAGLLCGLVIGLMPMSFRNFAGIRELVFGERTWRFSLVGLVANFVLTAWAYGSGSPGGLFAPSLTIGACLGSLMGMAEAYCFGTTSSSMTLALAGMGAVFCGVARVPITATVIVFEMTADFNLLLPLMISSITANYIAEKISPGSIYDRLLEMKGMHINESDDSDPLASMTVREAMEPEVETVPADMPLPELIQRLETDGRKAYPVMENGKLSGIVTQFDALTKRALLQENATVGDAMTRDVVTAAPEDSLEAIVTVFDQHGLNRLPVVDENGQLLGIITRSNIIKALAGKSS